MGIGTAYRCGLFFHYSPFPRSGGGFSCKKHENRYNIIMRRLFLVLLLCGCGGRDYIKVPTCPFGVPYMTQSDYEILSDPNKISDQFADWVIATGEFCEGENV